jgi:hypothetical protein
METSSPPATPGRWRFARLSLLAVAAVATLVAIFYTVENWRGKRAWEKSKRELEAAGEVLDWAAYIPPPVPDDQNFFKAPQMQEWFVKPPSKNPGVAESPKLPPALALGSRMERDLMVAEVRIAAANERSDSPPADAALRLSDPAVRAQAAKLLANAIGPCVIGARDRQCVLMARALDQFKPLHLVLQADTAPSPKELATAFLGSAGTNGAPAYSDIHLQAQSVGSNVFRLFLKAPVYGAADYLAYTEPLTADFDRVRKALERPYARIDCDYQQPFLIGLPNFITIRTVVQLLAQRAQCYLLLGQPEPAWHELALVNDVRQILMAKPSGKPITLVASMINVAVSGLYTGIIQEGLRLHAWREPQLLAFQRQLNQTDLLSPVVESFREEWAAVAHTFDTTTRGELVKLFDLGGSVTKRAMAWGPRGWFYQNLAMGAETRHEMLASIDLAHRQIVPHQVDAVVRKMAAASAKRSPYTFFVATAQPNYAKAVQTLAFNQTEASQAEVACALERYRLAHGQYPERLDSLSPQFIEKLPHDLIGGRPFNYHLTEGGGYLLYSVGWDEKDEGGVVGRSRDEGDWVWNLQVGP